VLVAALSGCALHGVETRSPVRWDARRDRLLQLAAWQARGRIAARSDTGGGQGILQWRQLDATTRIRLSGPFGAGSVEIHLDPGLLTVTDKNGTVRQSFSGPDAAEQFLKQQLGWSFPALSTRYWMLGLLDPDYSGRQVFDKRGWLVGLDQNGWMLSYQEFTRYGDDWMPHKLVMRSDRARIRVIIDKWTLH